MEKVTGKRKLADTCPSNGLGTREQWQCQSQKIVGTGKQWFSILIHFHIFTYGKDTSRIYLAENQTHRSPVTSQNQIFQSMHIYHIPCRYYYGVIPNTLITLCFIPVTGSEELNPSVYGTNHQFMWICIEYIRTNVWENFILRF